MLGTYFECGVVKWLQSPSVKFALQMVAGSSPAAAGSLVFVCHEGQQRLVLEPRRLGVLQPL